MKQVITGPLSPTASIAVNKSRLKVYESNGELPKYFLNSNQEFEIELYNPTMDVIKAKIKLNNKWISQSGLILRPGERIFLDRYIDVAKKFLFETYEVDSSESTKRAIQDNGDIHVEFFKERKDVQSILTTSRPWNQMYHYVDPNQGYGGTYNTLGGSFTTTSLSGNMVGSTNVNNTFTSSVSNADNEILSFNADSFKEAKPVTRGLRKLKLLSESPKNTPIETGRVEMGSDSKQTFKTVNKEFEYYAFHIVDAKLVPISQKPVSAKDLKKYCINCGAGLGKKHKFCASCGTKA